MPFVDRRAAHKCWGIAAGLALAGLSLPRGRSTALWTLGPLHCVMHRLRLETEPTVKHGRPCPRGTANPAAQVTSAGAPRRAARRRHSSIHWLQLIRRRPLPRSVPPATPITHNGGPRSAATSICYLLLKRPSRPGTVSMPMRSGTFMPAGRLHCMSCGVTARSSRTCWAIR